MKIPIGWLKEFVTLPKRTAELTDKFTMAGHMLDKTTVVDGEEVIDLELRGNRADCYSIVGIAREVAALFNTKIRKKPEISLSSGKTNLDLKVKTPFVKRVGMIEIKNVVITPSPKWLSQKLKAYGMDSVNNIVDLTNYVMIETGEPMHAFDLDKIGSNLEIRLALKGEKLTTFMGSSITLSGEDLVWAKPEQVLSVAGAVGEKYNSISPSTRNVLLEAANYDRANIRRTVYRHKLLTDAGIRHEKELDPEMVETAIGRFLYLLKKEGWGTFSPVFYDYYPRKVAPRVLELDLEQLDSLGGTKIDKKDVVDILNRLSFTVISSNKNVLKIRVPTYRTDVTMSEDIIEEILRIWGYEKIPEHVLSLPIPRNITPEFIRQEESARSKACSLGFSEAITNSFVEEDLSKYNKHPLELGNSPITIINAPSPDNQKMRISLLPNLYKHCLKAINEREESVKIFEIGKIYFKTGTDYEEERHVAFIYYQKDLPSFINFKSLILGFFAASNLAEPSFSAVALNIPLKESYELTLDGKSIGFGGKLTKAIYFLELNLDSLLGKRVSQKLSLWPKYPPQIEDLTVSLPEKTKIGEVALTIKAISPQISKLQLKDVYQGNYTFNIEYQDPKKTLNDEEVTLLRKKIISLIKSKFGGTTKD